MLVSFVKTSHLVGVSETSANARLLLCGTIKYPGSCVPVHSYPARALQWSRSH
jgi:hypothetical protein